MRAKMELSWQEGGKARMANTRAWQDGGNAREANRRAWQDGGNARKAMDESWQKDGNARAAMEGSLARVLRLAQRTVHASSEAWKAVRGTVLEEAAAAHALTVQTDNVYAAVFSD